MTAVPKTWAVASGEDLFSLIRGVSYNKSDASDLPGNGLIPVLRANNISDGQIVADDLVYVPSRYVSPEQYLKNGDLLIAASSGSRTVVGKAARAKESHEHFAFGAFCTVARPRNSDFSLWLSSYMNSRAYRDYVEQAALGININNLRGADLKAMPIQIAPMPEQRRIVVKIGSLSARYRRARDQLDHIPRLVDKYKQALLAAAFRGTLIGLSAGPTELPDPKCWGLPVDWRWVPFSEVAEIASKLVKPETVPDLPHIAPDNVEAGTGRLLPYRTIKEDEVISPKHRFRPGQLIYSKIRPYLRKAVIVDFEGACSADMYPLTPKDAVCGLFLFYWLISEQFAGFTVEHEGRTVLPKINQVGLNRTPFPLAPVRVQEEIAQRIKTAFAWIDRLASEATSARKLISHLDQAVLAKAFRGELVPQDPNDEPASVLLERIRAERQTTPTPRSRNEEERASKTAMKRIGRRMRS